MLDGLALDSVLEVGCNRGHNLQAIRALREPPAVRGIEPMYFARRIAHENGLDVRDGTVYEIPYEDGMFDLAFTCGVLIHVPPDSLHAAILELARVSRRYVLAVEYPAEQDQEVPYRGLTGMLWKRDYGAHYRETVPESRLVSKGDLGASWDDARWWLLEKMSDKSG